MEPAASASCVFNLPELLDLIFRLVPLRDQPSLLRVSTIFFLHAAPLIWGNICGVIKLFALFPQIQLERSSVKTTPHLSRPRVAVRL